VLVYAAVLACAALLAWLVWRYDLHDREPVWLLAVTLAAGFGAMRGAGHLEDAIFRALHDGLPTTLEMALVAAVVEESFKFALVLAVALLFRRHFDDPMDGLVYGAFAGLGMAVEESLHYLSFSTLDLETAGQEAVRLVAHLLMGAIGGFAVGMARLELRGHRPAIVAGLGASLTLHAAWDWASGTRLEHADAEGARRLAGIALMIVAMGIFGYLVRFGSELSRRHFTALGGSTEVTGRSGD